jgi:arginase family enzyme
MVSKIILYPFSVSSSENIAYDTAGLFYDKFKKYFVGKYGVSEKVIMSEARNEPSELIDNIKNAESVKFALENLFNEQCKAAWNGERPLTIGGDHSQGFATVKSTLFIPVLRNVLDGKLGKKLSVEERRDLKRLADSGDFISAYKKFDTFVDEGKISKYGIRRITDKIHVIWMDAHADYNTAHISPSKNFHGMSLAAASWVSKRHLGKLSGISDEKGKAAISSLQLAEIMSAEKLFGGIEDIGSKYVRADPRHTHILGTRDLDFVEEALMRILKVDYQNYEMHDTEKGKLRAQGKSDKEQPNTLDKVLSGVIAEIKDMGHKYMVSFDIDILTVNETGTPQGSHKNVRLNRFDKSPVGPNKKDAYKAISNLAKDQNCLAFDLTEVSTRYKISGVIKRGLQAITAGINVLASFVGGEQARKDVMKSIKQDNVLKHLYDAFEADPGVQFDRMS